MADLTNRALGLLRPRPAVAGAGAFSAPARPAMPRQVHRYSGGGRELTPMMCFDDVIVQHSGGRENPGVHWPEFERQYHARHLRAGYPMCRKPPVIEGEPARFKGPAMFIGSLDFHFGHICAELAPRIPQSLAEKPDLPIIFSWPRAGKRVQHGLEQALNPAFRSVLEWLGLPLKRAHFINTPTRFDKLWIAAQAEHSKGPPPPEAYLDLLDALARKRNLLPRPEGMVYVTRARLQGALGGHAGEAYLAQVLERLNVQVVAPEAEPLPRQLALYAGAQRLIFAEGSAIHGRQLLGRIDQDIDVLVRRPGARLAQNQLTPRCRQLGYVPASSHTLKFTDAQGEIRQHDKLALYDLPVLFDYFGAIGVPLRTAWDQAEYEAARDSYVLVWLRSVYSPDAEASQRPHNPPEYILNQLANTGLGHLVPEAREIIRNGPTIAGSTA